MIRVSLIVLFVLNLFYVPSVMLMGAWFSIGAAADWGNGFDNDTAVQLLMIVIGGFLFSALFCSPIISYKRSVKNIALPISKKIYLIIGAVFGALLSLMVFGSFIIRGAFFISIFFALAFALNVQQIMLLFRKYKHAD